MNNDFYEFWGEPISVYTDADAIEDGILTDVSHFGIKFNSLPINRLTTGASLALRLEEKGFSTAKNNLQFIADNCKLDDGWGIFQPDSRFGNEKFWLIPNEINGITIMLPSEY